MHHSAKFQSYDIICDTYAVTNLQTPFSEVCCANDTSYEPYSPLKFNHIPLIDSQINFSFKIRTVK